jgi:murein DD-endopeptidase MepM/ murein hydrolase activator NlpD
MIKLRSPFYGKDKHPLTQGFGENPEVYQRFGLPAHNGLDFSCPEGTKLVACADGIVVMSKTHSSYGEIVKIKHKDGYFSLYCHLSKRLVREGETIKSGDFIGLSGSTGFSTGPHLHFGLQSIQEGTKPYNYYIDPLIAFKASLAQATKTDDSDLKSESTRKKKTSSKGSVKFLRSSKKISSLEEKTTTKKKVKTSSKYIFNKDLNYRDRDPEVIKLQERLKLEGFFDYPNFTEYYGPVTRQAVLKYQISKAIVSSPYDTGAGRLGPGTRASLNS